MPGILDGSYARKVAITGASGFVGGRLRQALLEAGADVVSLIRADSPPAREGRSAPVDYAQAASLRHVFALERPEVVFHVAGATKGVTLEDFRRGNVLPTRAIGDALRDAHPGVSRFVHVSSGTAYGPSNEGPAKREVDERTPVEHYGRSKLEAERYVESLGDSVPWTIVRPVGVYGPGDVDFFELFRAAHRHINLSFGNRAKRASFVYVDDLVRAIVLAAESPRAVGRGYFISDGTPRTWDELQDHIVRAVGKRTLRLDLPAMTVKFGSMLGEALTSLDGKPRLLNRQKAILDAQQAWLFDCSQAREELGYRQSVELEEGTRRTYVWYREQGWL